MNEIDQVIKVLGGDNGTATQILAGIGTARLIFKVVSGHLQAAMQKAIDSVLSTESKSDDAIMAKVLASVPYRAVAFFVDWIASIKLPQKLNGQVK